MRLQRTLVTSFFFCSAIALLLSACGPKVPVSTNWASGSVPYSELHPAPSATPTPLNLPVQDDDNSGTGGLYLGAVCLPGGPVRCGTLAKVLRHHIAIGTEFTGWNTDLVAYMHSVGMDKWPQQQTIPEITWLPNGVLYSDINAGKYDAYLTQQARELRAAGYPVFLRPFHEFNGFWWTWALSRQGADTQADQDFISAWRRMVNIFRAQGASNVKFVWCFSSSALYAIPKDPWDNPAAAYPGDAYVDWVSFDGYNRGTSSKPQQWLPFDRLFKQAYQLATSIAPLKPISISEVASNEYGDGGAKKAAWITDMFSELLGPSNPYPHLRLISWYEADNVFHYFTESSGPAYTAFATDIRAKDRFGNLEVRSNGDALLQVSLP